MTPWVTSNPPTDLHAEFGANIAYVVMAVASRTKHQSIDTAAATLRVDLRRSGVRAEQQWCEQVLRERRRGDEAKDESGRCHHA
jgi:hypothetical protein